jgi:hypothetical protein
LRAFVVHRSFVIMNARVLTTSSLITLLAVTALAACKDDEKPKSWACGSEAVPGGEVVTCTQNAQGQALVLDPEEPFLEDCSGIIDTESCGYTCAAGDANCPLISDSATTGGTSGGGAGTTTPPTNGSTDGTTTTTPPTGGAGTTTPPPPVSTDDGSNQSDKGANGNSGNGNGGGSSNGNGNGNPNASDNGASGNSECAYVPELCGDGSGGAGSSDGSGSSSPPVSDSGANGNNGNGNGGGSSNGNGSSSSSGSPGQEKKNDGASSSSSSSSSGGADSGDSDGDICVPSGGGSGSQGKGKGKGPKKFKCHKDNKGNKKCTTTSPTCNPGHVPSQSEGGCWITGGGFIVAPNDLTGAPADGNGHDNFGGNAKTLKDGRMQGHWNHVDHGTQNHAKGKPEYLVCRHVDEPGPGQPGGKKGFNINQVYFGGHAEWRDAKAGTWASGYWFDVVVKDHGEPGSKPHVKNGGMPDTYHFTIRKIDDANAQASGTVVYEVGRPANAHGELIGGNIQIHPPNPGRGPNNTQLPAWVSYEP